jgi:RinA family phage transcriptional activator
MDKGIKKHVEYELKNYLKTRDKFITVLEEQDNKSLVTCNRLSYMDRIIKAIERNLEALDPTQLKFIEMHYWKNKYNIQFIAQHLDCGVRTLHNWKSKLIENIAEDMGWID